ncbi:ABC transporter permease subunit [Abyssisolibacter fermentans]|uniref:ABC transporter permease subunit n=1 Tax=Abyssisolibacter fermentans TaxID=1766203 RepID=UPI000836CC1B|nr:ABC transporter permease subunit [Abyssisolibacter fermentans]
MNIFKYEFKSYLKENIIWTVSLILCLLLFLSIYPSFSSEAEKLERLLNNFPETFKKAFGFNNLTFSSINSFYSMIFMYIKLIGAIFAMKLGLDIMSKEIREKTVEFLVVKPVNRKQIITPKFLAVLTHVIIMNVIYLICALLLVQIFKKVEFDFKTFLLISLSLFFIQIFFLTFGILIGTIVKKIKSVLPITMGVVFGFYIIQLLNNTLQDKKLSYISPFGYFDPDSIMLEIAYKTNYLILNFILAMVFICFAYIRYQKKDFPSI